jgi:seryl-tRNA synthetase
MVDLKDLREHPDKYRRDAELKGVAVPFDQILEADSRRLGAQQEFEKLRNEQNEASKLIGRLKDPAEKQAAIAKMGELKDRVKQADERARAAESELEPLLLQVPQPPDDDVPIGKDVSANILARTWGTPRKFEFKPKGHIELAEALGIVDFEAAAAIAGSRSYFLKGVGAELHQAVLRFALDTMTREHGFCAMTVPVIVREAAMRGTGFFPAGREQTYHVDSGDDQRFLTGTAEVSLTAYHMNAVLDEAKLPLKYAAISTCFRREAGTYGKDTAGLYRVHQFDKCEQVVICKNDVGESKRWHMEMLGYSEQLLQRLELPYRVMQCCTGDIGVKNAAMYDIETWMPSRQHGNDASTGYGETHSASRLYEFQSRRLNLRYKGADGKVRFCHTLNNTVVASPRILIPILENYQTADGCVSVPQVLRPYLGGRERIEPAARSVPAA